jgi:endonuclease-3
MPRESKTARKQRVAKIIAILSRQYPEAECRLDYKTPLQLLIATIMAAQCTDDRVNIVTKGLFKKYRTAAAFAKAKPEELQADIRSTGFFRNKAKSIIGAATKIVGEFGGKVPRTMDELLTLPGVARKTANVVLGNAFGINEGVIVDTHMIRLSMRLKITDDKKKDPVKIERDVNALVPREQWTDFSHWILFHGRAVCNARKPKCDDCAISQLCPSAGKV